MLTTYKENKMLFDEKYKRLALLEETTNANGGDTAHVFDERPVVVVSQTIYDFAMDNAPELLSPVNATRMDMWESLDTQSARVVGVILGTEVFGPGEFELFPNLKVVSRVGTGTDNVVVPDDRKIRVERADMSTARAVTGYDLQMASYALEFKDRCVGGFVPRRMSDCRIGIIGLGAIGAYLWSTLDYIAGPSGVLGFDVDPHARREPNAVSAVDVVRNSDILFVHIPLTNQNIGFLNQKLMSELPSGAIVVAPVRLPVLDLRVPNWDNYAFGRGDITLITDCYCQCRMQNVIDTRHTATRGRHDFCAMIRESVSNLLTALCRKDHANGGIGGI